MTNEELILKFCENAEGFLSAANIGGIVDAVMSLEKVADVGTIMRMAGNAPALGQTSKERLYSA